MTRQITNLIDVSLIYEYITGVVEKLHRKIKVIITEKSCWQKETTTVITAETPEDAAKVQQFLGGEIGGKEIIVNINLI